MTRRVALLLRLDHRYERDVVLGASVRAAALGWELLLPGFDDLPADPAAIDCDAVVMRRVSGTDTTGWCDPRPAVNVSAQVVAGAEQVCVDPQAIGGLAAEHLLRLGFRRLVWRSSGTMDRLSGRGHGFIACARSAGATVTECLWQEDGPVPWSVDAEIADCAQQLARCGPRLGIGAFSCDVARRTLAACRRLELRVPEDAALIACDHDEVVCCSCRPGLSAVDVGADRVGRLAIDRLAARLAGGGPQPPSLLPPLRVLAAGSSDPAAVADPLLADAMGWIRDHAAGPCSIDVLVQHLNCSRRLLELRFRAVLGRSPGAEILRARLELAKSLLADSELGLDAIAVRCGFARASRLVESFSRMEGVTPGDWRQRRRAPPAM